MNAPTRLQPLNCVPSPRLISIRQVVLLLGIGRTLAYELIAEGKLKTVRIGRRRFVTAEAIDEFIGNLPA